MRRPANLNLVGAALVRVLGGIRADQNPNLWLTSVRCVEYGKTLPAVRSQSPLLIVVPSSADQTDQYASHTAFEHLFDVTVVLSGENLLYAFGEAYDDIIAALWRNSSLADVDAVPVVQRAWVSGYSLDPTLLEDGNGGGTVHVRVLCAWSDN